MITERENRKAVLEVRLKRSAELSTDHYLLVAKIRKTFKEGTKILCKKKRSRDKNSTRIYKFCEEEIERQLRENIEEEIDKRGRKLRKRNLEKK